MCLGNVRHNPTPPPQLSLTPAFGVHSTGSWSFKTQLQRLRFENLTQEIGHHSLHHQFAQSVVLHIEISALYSYQMSVEVYSYQMSVKVQNIYCWIIFQASYMGHGNCTFTDKSLFTEGSVDIVSSNFFGDACCNSPVTYSFAFTSNCKIPMNVFP